MKSSGKSLGEKMEEWKADAGRMGYYGMKNLW